MRIDRDRHGRGQSRRAHRSARPEEQVFHEDTGFFGDSGYLWDSVFYWDLEPIDTGEEPSGGLISLVLIPMGWRRRR